MARPRIHIDISEEQWDSSQEGEITMTSLAEEAGISLNTLKAHARLQGWKFKHNRRPPTPKNPPPKKARMRVIKGNPEIFKRLENLSEWLITEVEEMREIADHAKRTYPKGDPKRCPFTHNTLNGLMDLVQKATRNQITYEEIDAVKEAQEDAQGASKSGGRPIPVLFTVDEKGAGTGEATPDTVKAHTDSVHPCSESDLQWATGTVQGSPGGTPERED